jgi:hypothetical protein
MSAVCRDYHAPTSTGKNESVVSPRVVCNVFVDGKENSPVSAVMFRITQRRGDYLPIDAGIVIIVTTSGQPIPAQTVFSRLESALLSRPFNVNPRTQYNNIINRGGNDQNESKKFKNLSDENITREREIKIFRDGSYIRTTVLI